MHFLAAVRIASVTFVVVLLTSGLLRSSFCRRSSVVDLNSSQLAFLKFQRVHFSNVLGHEASTVTIVGKWSLDPTPSVTLLCVLFIRSAETNVRSGLC